MRNRMKWLMGLAALLLLIGGHAAAQTRYEALNTQNKMNNADVIAWLEIPGASICEPVMCHPTDDTYYAKHASDGNENAVGSLYIQRKYNANDISDPATLIYGSSASEEALFGRLQEMYSGSFDSCREMYIHLPEETREYEVFAALPHSSFHILHYYDFRIERQYDSFFENVFSTRALGMHLDENKRPEYGKDRVIILSTVLRGDPLQRYLVMARLINR